MGRRHRFVSAIVAVAAFATLGMVTTTASPAPIERGAAVVAPTHAFTPLSPARVLDTRGNGDKPTAGSVTEVVVAGVVGVPADASAVVVNLTATESSAPGFVTAYPAGASRPEVSNLNLDASDQTRAVQATVAVGTGGKIDLYNHAGSHLVVDIDGYYRPASLSTSGRLVTLSPARLLDTRLTGVQPGPFEVRSLPIIGRSGVPSNASAIVVNLTATNAAAAGYVTAYPGGSSRPTASNLNLADVGDTAANLVTIPIGTDGAIDLFTQSGADLVVDVVAYYTGTTAPQGSRGLYVPAQSRLVDTRTGTQPAPGQTIAVPLGAASNASAVVVTAVATEALFPGFVSLYPAGQKRPGTSTLNHGAGATVANDAVVANDGGVAALTQVGAHLVIDLAGYFTAGDPSAPVQLQLLSFNDYHGHLKPPAGTDSTLGATLDPANTPVGGSEYLATTLANLRGSADETITATAGDLIGGSPFLSGLFHDEPSVETLEAMGLDVSSVGNHEFDEGLVELQRMQNGGCHPVDGCYVPSDPYNGASFPWLAANVVQTSSGHTVLPPTWVRNVDGVKVGFIGMTLHGTPELVAQAGIVGLEFRDEIVTANAAAATLQAQGVQSIIVLLHEGGIQTGTFGGCAGISGPIVAIAQGLAPAIDMIVSGHTHQPYVCNFADPAGKPRMVTSASSFGRVVTDTRLSLDRTTGDVDRSSVVSTNHLVDHTVAKDPTQTSIIAKWDAKSAPIGNRVIGAVATDLTRAANRDAESNLGNVIADAQLAATSAPGAGGAQIALMNPGGIRGDLKVSDIAGGEQSGEVTFGEAFTVQPFGNLLVTITMTGAQLEQVLEQQAVATRSRPVLILGISKGLTFDYSASAPFGSRIDPVTLKLNGVVVDPVTTYRVTVNNFLADGGDGFTVFTQGTGRTGGGDDLTALVNYIAANRPVASPGTGRINEVP